MVHQDEHTSTEREAITFSNAVRLSLRQWLVVGLFAAALIAIAPTLWRQFEAFDPPADYRMPHELSNDYWLFERFAGLAAARGNTLLLGDSVVWGEYVIPPETLSHYLNEIDSRHRYANLGLDGAFPLALEGLIAHYGGSIAGKYVIVQCNPLWMSSPRRDLQDDSAESFNHPRLVPQFTPKIPRYKEEISHRLGVLVEQRVPFNKWTNHLQQAYYDQTDIPSWTLKHPYENPLAPLSRGLPPSDDTRWQEPIPWTKRGIKDVDYEWLDLDKSLQWGAFQHVIEILQSRGNRIFVLVGPFNEHLLTPASRARYQEVKATITTWLKAKQIPHIAPAPLPSELYGDASHPLAAGYTLLARQLKDAKALDREDR